MTGTQREFYKNSEIGLTKKETDFIFKLEQSGYYGIDIISPNYAIMGEDESEYFFTLNCPFSLTENNSDSIKSISDSLADVLYSRVISDSAIFCSRKVSIHFIVDTVYIDDAVLWQSYSKKILEARNGFEVIEIAEGEFERVKR
jgi:hypothetical protein